MSAARGGEGRGHEKRGDELFRGDDGRPLPWLEPEEDEEHARGSAGFDPARAAGVILGGLALLGALAAAGWWLLDAREDAEIAATGGIIAAPEGPYKVRPAERGGTSVAGTGDISFAIAEGEAREGRIAGREPVADEDAGSASADGVGVQIGAFPSNEEATRGWETMRTRIPALDGRGHRILEAPADAGMVYQLQVVAGSEAEAGALCEAIRADGGDCQVKD